MTPAEAIPDPLREHLERLLSPPTAQSGAHPLVLLSWAQSIDAALSHSPGQRTPISGPESQLLTHLIRSMVDGICVGIGTVLADRPQLSTRAVPGPSPRPVILDSRLRTPPDSAFIAGRSPLIYFRAPAEASREPEDFANASQAAPGGATKGLPTGLLTRQAALTGAGAICVPVAAGPGGGLDLGSVLSHAAAAGIASLMVEGGSQVLSAFLEQGLASACCITVAPRFLPDGLPIRFSLPASSESSAGIPLSHVVWYHLGQDAVLLGSTTEPASC